MAYFHTTVLDEQIKALPTVSTASGSVATFDTDLTENLVEVKCQIVATQSGSGTPSPSNPRPITVYNSLTLGQDANYDKFLDFNQLIQNGNFASTSNWSAVRGSISVSNNECAYTLSEITTVSTGNRIQQLVTQLKSHKYIVMMKVKVPHASTIGIECYNVGLVTSKSVSDIDAYVDCDVLFSANATSSAYFYWGISDSTGSGYAIGDTVYFKDIQLIDLTQCFGETLADYIYSLGQTDGIAYVKNLLPNSYYDYTISTIETLGTANNDGTGNTYNIPFGQTVAGGVLDVTTGKLAITHGYIASYNGESINEPWISSIDEYVENTSPSTGASVVYPLSTPQEIQLDSITLQALLNENNIWCDTGDTEVKYLLTVGKKIS